MYNLENRYKDRQANKPLIRYYIRHSSDKRLAWLLEVINKELAKRGQK